MADRRHFQTRGAYGFLLAGIISLGLICSAASAVDRTGAEIYTEMCVRCHGPNGEGVADKHDEPLSGDRSLKSLVRVIEKTMPEDTDAKCTPEEAEKVAAYIYEKFYSPSARNRLAPPKIDLARLTVRQYQNSVADLVGSFTDKREIGKERGLRGEYYASRNFRRERHVLNRTDARVRADFGTASPDPSREMTEAEVKEMKKKEQEEENGNREKSTEKETVKYDREEFSIRWTGSIIAEETGDYEFRLKTQNGARLFVNNDNKALIDEWVSSGTDVREHKETIRLLGGRAYPLKLDFFKYKEKNGSIVLEWKPPHKSWEVIPERSLSPSRMPEVMVVSTAFPADDGSAGYERGTMVSKAWDQATTHAAIEVAGRMVEKMDALAGTKSDAANRREKVTEFCQTFVERAFRRPLTADEKRVFIQDQFSEAKDLDSAVKRVVILALKSPRFLYPELPQNLEKDYLVASRLALNLWDSIPDSTLLQAAGKGELQTQQQVEAQTRRMLADSRARMKMKEFFHHWLEMEEAEDLMKDPSTYPDFTDGLLSDLRTSLELFIDDVVWNDKSDYRQLLKANYLYLNRRLATFYSVKLPTPAKPSNADSTSEKLESEDAGKTETDLTAKTIENDEEFQKVAFDPKERVGVLTHPYLLSTFAYFKNSSPIHRGVFLTRNIIGRALKPPPMAIQFMDGRFDPSLTMREKVTELTSAAACMGCHAVINPLGFSLEHFDGVGRFRTMDNNKPVDAVSDFTTDDGETIRLTGARDVAEYASKSPEAHRGFTRQLFQHVAKQPVQAYGAETLEKLRASFESSEFNIQKLVAEIAVLTALHAEDPNAKNDSTSAIHKQQAANN